MPKNLKISGFDSVIQTHCCYHDFEVTQNNCMLIIDTTLQQCPGGKKQLTSSYKCTGTAPKQAKTVAELELMRFLNRRLLWLTWLLSNLNCESQKVHGLYKLLAVVMGSLLPGCMTPKTGISRKSYSLALNCSLFPLL